VHHVSVRAVARAKIAPPCIAMVKIPNHDDLYCRLARATARALTWFAPMNFPDQENNFGTFDC